MNYISQKEIIMPTILAEKALKSTMETENSNKSKFDMNTFIQKIEKAASLMQLSMSQCQLKNVPDFVRPDYDKKIPHDNNNQLIKNAYKLKCKDDSDIYMVLHAGGRVEFLSDHWTEESINQAADLAAKISGEWRLLPSGTPGEIPDHLRAFAQRAFAQRGISLSDPTPPSQAMIEKSRLKYEAATAESQLLAPNTSGQFKNRLKNISDNQSDTHGKLEKNDSHSSITPFRTKPKLPGEI